MTCVMSFTSIHDAQCMYVECACVSIHDAQCMYVECGMIYCCIV